MIEKLSLTAPEAETPEILDLSQFLVNPDFEVKPPKPILSLNQNGRNIWLFTEDNISMIQGRAKSRKSTFLWAICAAIASGRYDDLHSEYQRNHVCIVDTEQGEYDCWRAARMIKTLSQVSIPYYRTAGTTTEQKKSIVEQHLKDNPYCGFIILDNIVHFLKNFNDPTESAELNQWLIKVKADYRVHICLVLHENGSDMGNGKAKGHLGSLLENTCETIIRIEKDRLEPTRSTVSPKAMRGLEFDAFDIEVDLDKKPHLRPRSISTTSAKL